MSGLTYHGEELVFPQTRTLQSLQRAVRTSQHSIHNRLLSVQDDIAHLLSLLPLYPPYPLLPNLRCGAWYTPPSHASRSAYFKSSDGHCGHWQLSSVRLNLPVVEAAVEAGGCWLVDSTRQGKRWPDSFSRTVPIWACTVNRAVQRHRQRALLNGKSTQREECKETEEQEEDELFWAELCLPEWVSDSERQQVEQRLPDFVTTFALAAGPTNMALLARTLTRPLRPMYVDRSTPLPGAPSQLADLPFLPLLLCNPSSTAAPSEDDRRGWTYIQGAADDEAHWARGLAVADWWARRDELLAVPGPRECEELVDEIVRERRRRLEESKEERKEAEEDVIAYAIGNTGLLIARATEAPTVERCGADAVLYLQVMHGREEASALNRDRRKASPHGADDDDFTYTNHTSAAQPSPTSSCSPPAATPTSLTIAVSGVPKDKRSLQDILPSALAYVSRCRALGRRVLVASGDWSVAASVCIGAVIGGCDAEYAWVGEGGVGVLQASVSKASIRVASNAVYSFVPNEFVTRLQLKQLNMHFLT